MNRYARPAYAHTRQHRPKTFAAMARPPRPLHEPGRGGREPDHDAAGLAARLARGEQSLEDYRRRSYQARRQAEEVVLAEVVWTEPAPTTEPDDDEILAYRSWLATASRTLASLDRSCTDPGEPEAPPRP